MVRPCACFGPGAQKRLTVCRRARNFPAAQLEVECGGLARSSPEDVGFWHLADIPPALTNVRYGGKSGHDANGPLCRRMTLSGHSIDARRSQFWIVRIFT
jgi:hypothetical protein